MSTIVSEIHRQRVEWLRANKREPNLLVVSPATLTRLKVHAGNGGAKVCHGSGGVGSLRAA